MEDLIKSHESRIQQLEQRIAAAEKTHTGILTSATWIKTILAILFAGMAATVLWDNVRDFFRPPAARVIQSGIITIPSQGESRASRTFPVRFSTPFRSAPQVLISVPHFQGPLNANPSITIDAKATEVSSSGFNCTFNAPDVRIDAGTIHWIAYGN